MMKKTFLIISAALLFAGGFALDAEMQASISREDFDIIFSRLTSPPQCQQSRWDPLNVNYSIYIPDVIVAKYLNVLFVDLTIEGLNTYIISDFAFGADRISFQLSSPFVQVNGLHRMHGFYSGTYLPDYPDFEFDTHAYPDIDTVTANITDLTVRTTVNFQGDRAILSFDSFLFGAVSCEFRGMAYYDEYDEIISKEIGDVLPTFFSENQPFVIRKLLEFYVENYSVEPEC
ncbi:CLUMA_CG003102, isoform A [Clunio marinus]|uniref:CLUMA_CG003102, isoform A n=1 Tax=Clunio marinus TaxID=568069 RepID=A0A1J1HMR4_9DIPT|nr:CLUMA_CG003102, isoform A [Clunio marinus]